jgi:hypothetical protein
VLHLWRGRQISTRLAPSRTPVTLVHSQAAFFEADFLVLAGGGGGETKCV